MDGILIIDKPDGITSHDVVSRCRRILRTKRIGHTGTLDPFATGVVVILVEKATRLAQFLDKDAKEYEAVARFGFETDTGDRTGIFKDEGRRMNEDETAEILKQTDWNEIFKQFRGEILQTPPMYSAKKVEGKKLYELARKGVEIERKAVKVNIYNLEILKDQSPKTKDQIAFR
ncbi:MAG TPA: tRNA pseudouridine(55) synthase TruB, partial [Pyrinomonadaceae bacterium]|nr:tRNA pseudouridine(55) synthase TruB [Pyrinomonadaceae bacterium]